MIADSFIAAFAGFLVYLLSVCAAIRIWSDHPAQVVIGVAVIAYPAALLVALMLGGHISFWIYSAIYSSLTLMFLMAFGAVYKSISLRILLDLYKSPGRAERYEAMLRRLVQAESFEARLDVMQSSGFVRRAGDRYVLQKRGDRLARRVRALQAVFGIERSG
jgi:hypothetical protein